MKNIILTTFLLTLSTVHAAESVEHRMATFSTAVGKCLSSTDLFCLERFVQQSMYFPDQKEFGCQTGDFKNRWNITAHELNRCASTSSVKRKGCGDKDLTLKEILRACFLDMKTRRSVNPMRFSTANGNFCEILEENGELVISSISCAP